MDAIGHKRFVKFGTVGCPDLTGVIRLTCGYKDGSNVCIGQSFCIEVKASGDVLSEKQKLFKTLYEKAGGTYIIAHDVGDVIAAFNKLLEAQ
jgi:hypothetical protein